MLAVKKNGRSNTNSLNEVEPILSAMFSANSPSSTAIRIFLINQLSYFHLEKYFEITYITKVNANKYLAFLDFILYTEFLLLASSFFYTTSTLCLFLYRRILYEYEINETDIMNTQA